MADFIIEVKTKEDFSLEIGIEVSYGSNGPWFLGLVSPSDLTCSEKDKGWSFKLPEVEAAD